MKVTQTGLAVLLPLSLLLLFDQLAWQRQVVPPESTDRGDHHAALVSALAEICPEEKITWAEKGTVSGCSVCPAHTAFRDERGEGFQLALRRATLGHFTSAEADNIVLSSAGCEPHSMYFGGSFVFVFKSGRPRLLAYNEALITERCQKLFFPDGRDFLVCEVQWGGQGITESYVYSVAFDEGGRGAIGPIFTTIDTVGTCGEEPEGNLTRPVQRSTVQRVGFPDLNADGRADLSITATLGTKLLTESERRACLQAGGDSDPPSGAPMVPYQEYEIKFLFDGKTFNAAPGSQEVIKLFPDPQHPFSK